MNSSNPVFSRMSKGQYATFNSPTPAPSELQDMYDRPAYAPPRIMTLDDVVQRTAAVLGVLTLTGAITWILTPSDDPQSIMPVALIAALVGFVLALVISFKMSTNPALILSYAAVEGVFLGGISGVFEHYYEGIVIQAVLGTVGVFAGMLIVYKTGAIRVTPKFTRFMMGALIGVVVLALANSVAYLFVDGGLGLRDGGGLAILFSLVAIAVASLFFLLDFDMVDKAIRQGAPQRFAWYAAFGLAITLIWLYLEILRLLSYLRD